MIQTANLHSQITITTKGMNRIAQTSAMKTILLQSVAIEIIEMRVFCMFQSHIQLIVFTDHVWQLM